MRAVNSNFMMNAYNFLKDSYNFLQIITLFLIGEFSEEKKWIVDLNEFNQRRIKQRINLYDFLSEQNL